MTPLSVMIRMMILIDTLVSRVHFTIKMPALRSHVIPTLFPCGVSAIVTNVVVLRYF
jgi:hypothetical protein